MNIQDLQKRGDKFYDKKGNLLYRIIDEKIYQKRGDDYFLLKKGVEEAKSKTKNLFVDKNRKINEIYKSENSWTQVNNISDFKKFITKNLENLPEVISVDYDLEKRKEGVLCIRYVVDKCIQFRIKIPTVYVHCNDRNKIIEFENELDHYSKKTNKSYSLEFIKRF